MKWLGYVLYGIYVLTMIWLFLSALMQLHLLWHARKTRAKRAAGWKGELPMVTIQVPVYNEKFVIAGLLHSLSGLDYPKSRYEVQVLDDSTDETSNIIDGELPLLRAKGLQIEVIRRSERKGFKAGALQYGLASAKGSLIAIFDADFRPPSHFLRSLIPYFSDNRCGLVQARWGHLNAEDNFLTRIQQYFLDTYFNIEQAGRHNAGYFINFCGTAGIWRKECILDAGGWDGNVLSEDLDLSYRAQLKGWRLHYEPEMEVPAELPAVMEAFKIQQFRWTKGIAQTSRKTLKRLLSLPLSFGIKLHSTFHLLSSFVFVCLFVNALLTIPLLLFRNLYPEFVMLTNYTVLGGLNLVILTIMYYTGTKDAQGGPRRFFKRFPLFLVVYLAMSVQNAMAVLQGLWNARPVFVRTPKFAAQGAGNSGYLTKKVSWINVMELLLLAYFLYGIGLSFYLGDYFLLLFFLMMSVGLGVLVYQSMLKGRLTLGKEFRAVLSRML